MTIDFKALGAKATELSGKDMTKAQAGGGGFEAAKEGFCLLRLVGYFEIGKQAGTYQGKPTIKDKVRLVFEVSGPNHPPRVLDDGTLVPHLVKIEETFSLSEKARFFKLFRTMNYKGEATHMVQLMGDPFKGRIIHRKYKRRSDTEATGMTGLEVELYDKNAGAFTIAPPRTEIIDNDTGMPTGEVRVLVVPPAITPLKAFLWDLADLESWTSLFVEGEYPERKNDKGEVTAPAKSKNELQNTIKRAANFKGSPIYNLIAEAGGNLDLPEAEVPESEEDDGGTEAAAKPEPAVVPTGEAADDALNGVV